MASSNVTTHIGSRRARITSISSGIQYDCRVFLEITIIALQQGVPNCSFMDGRKNAYCGSSRRTGL
jgi:hypothetical protein